MCNTKDELKVGITAVFIILNKDTVEKTCRSFWSRIETQFKANGDFIE